MMVPHLQRVTENDNMILLQNEDWFSKVLSSGYLKGTLKHCKVTIGKDMCFTGGGFEEALIFLTKMASSQPKTGLPWRAWKRSMLSYQFGKGIEGVASESPRVFATK